MSSIARVPIILTTVNVSVPTPSAGFGTITNHSSSMHRVAEWATFKGSFTLGTVTAATASFTLPTGFVINTAIISNNGTPYLGRAQRFSAGSAPYALDIGQVLFYDGSITNQVFFAALTGTNQYSKLPTSNSWVSNTLCDYEFTIPIV